MSERRTPIQRWQKPFAALQNNSEISTTLLKVHSIFLETMLSLPQKLTQSKVGRICNFRSQRTSNNRSIYDNSRVSIWTNKD